MNPYKALLLAQAEDPVEDETLYFDERMMSPEEQDAYIRARQREEEEYPEVKPGDYVGTMKKDAGAKSLLDKLDSLGGAKLRQATDKLDMYYQDELKKQQKKSGKGQPYKIEFKLVEPGKKK